MLSLVDDAGHDEKKHAKIQDGDDGLFVAAEEWAVGAQTRYELVGVQEPERAQNTQEARPSPATGARKEKIATMSAQVEGWANSRIGWGLT